MELLSPEEIKKDKSKTTEESQARSRAAAIEEAKINLELNQSKANAENQKNIIKSETDTFVKEQEARKETIRLEVATFEERRKELLKPINQLKIEAENVLKNAKEQALEVAEVAKRLEVGKERLSERIDDLNDKEGELKDRELDLDEREQNLDNEETRLKESQQSLAGKWVEYHEATNLLNKNIRKVEFARKDIEVREKSIAIRTAEQKKKDIELANHDRQIRDKYATLAHAIEESKNKYNIE